MYRKQYSSTVTFTGLHAIRHLFRFSYCIEIYRRYVHTTFVPEFSRIPHRTRYNNLAMRVSNQINFFADARISVNFYLETVYNYCVIYLKRNRFCFDIEEHAYTPRYSYSPAARLKHNGNSVYF